MFFKLKASYFSLLILLFTLTKPRSQAWTNLLHRTRFFECTKSKSASDGHLTGNVGFCSLTCGFNFKRISIKILRNLNVVEIFEIRCLSRKFFILQIHPFKVVQKNMLKKRSFTINKLCQMLRH